MVNGLREIFNSASFPKFALRLRISSKRHRHEVLAEGVFRRIFCWERKRAERSGRCFLLMLVDVESILQAKQSERALSEVVSALCSSTRETDLVGWHREGATLGVIFTEICEEGCKALASLLTAVQVEARRARSDSHLVPLLPGELGQV